MNNNIWQRLRIVNCKLIIVNHRGFTLIELMIAMGVFVLVIGIIANIFITSLQRQRSVVALMVANDNASLALEQMAREIRTGSGFSVDVNGALHFMNAKGEAIEYRYNAHAIERRVDLGTYFPLTSGNVTISALRFLLPNINNALWPPRIVINAQVTFTDRFLQNAVNDFQTTVSAREI
ncbi:MAG: prepilin-type N-terminal cleavage/methylation domain-containing protein [Patescibacteria group bacterium]